MATNVAATTAPEVWNGRTMPRSLSSQGPSRPRRPKPRSRATPPTVGGSTIGRRTSERTSALPGKWTRARSQASGTPRTRDSPSAQKDTRSDSRRASVTPGPVRWEPSSRHSVRARMPISGNSRNAIAIRAGTARAVGVRVPGARGLLIGGSRVRDRPAARLGPGAVRCGSPHGPGQVSRGAGHGCWKPASRRSFCASGVLSHLTKSAAASEFSDSFRVAAG